MKIIETPCGPHLIFRDDLADDVVQAIIRLCYAADENGDVKQVGLCIRALGGAGWKYADPVEGACAIWDDGEAAVIRAADPGLIYPSSDVTPDGALAECRRALAEADDA